MSVSENNLVSIKREPGDLLWFFKVLMMMEIILKYREVSTSKQIFMKLNKQIFEKSSGFHEHC